MFLALGAAALAVTLLAQKSTQQPPKQSPPQAPQQKLTPLTVEAYNKLIAAHKGRVVLVNFWATYCVPCRTEIPELAKFATQHNSRGLDLVLISADEPAQEAQALKFITGKYPLPLYIKRTDDNDKYVAAIHDHWDGSLPASFVYDRSGKKVGAFLGVVPLKNLQDLIAKIM